MWWKKSESGVKRAIYLSSTYHLSIIYPSSICNLSTYLSIIYLSFNYHQYIINLSSFYHLSTHTLRVKHQYLILVFTDLLLTCLLSTMLLLLRITFTHSCSCFHLPSCWNLSKTPYWSCLQSSSRLVDDYWWSFVLFYNLSRLSDDHWWSFDGQSRKLLLCT